MIAPKNGIHINHRSNRTRCFNKKLEDHFIESSGVNTSNSTLNNSMDELKALFYSAVDRKAIIALIFRMCYNLKIEVLAY